MVIRNSSLANFTWAYANIIGKTNKFGFCLSDIIFEIFRRNTK